MKKIASSYVTTIVLFLVYATCLAMATFIEKYHGTEMARTLVYYSPLFILLQGLFVVNFAAVVIRHRLLKRGKWGFLLVHASFVVILLGALVSHLSGKEGILHLREGESSSQMAVQASGETSYHPLPFRIELVKFTLTRYPGSSSPSSYESAVLVHVDGNTYEGRIFMNNVLDIKGYRLFQASYDKDEKGTVLSVNKDVAGRRVTYTGYVLLTIGLIGCIVGRNSRLRQLGRQLSGLRGAVKTVAVIAVWLTASTITAQPPAGASMLQAVQRFAIDPGHATRFGALPMQSYSGRMQPVNTFASEILRKLHKSDKIGSLTPDQFLLSFLAMPDMWMRVPFIALSNKEIAAKYGFSPGECAYIEAFDTEGNYKLQNDLDAAYGKMPAERTRFDKDLIKLDEQVNICYQLFSYQLLAILPRENDPDRKWYAPGDDLSGFSGKDSLFVAQAPAWYLAEVQGALKEGTWGKADEILAMITTYQNAKANPLDIDPKKIEAELKYNKMNVFRWCKIGYLILGGLLLALAFASLFRKRKWMGWLVWLLAACVLVTFHYHMLGMGARWYIAGRAPWSNSYETMVYVSWASVCAGLLFMRRSTITFALATLFGGVILFVSGLNWMDPEINPLVPVLKSPWLMFHVAVIVAAYGFFGISCLIGITNLVMQSVRSKAYTPLLSLRIKELSIVNEMSLIIGLALMTIGTFLGAVWANESWGRYWGWDPKETWALITMIVYAAVIHLRLLKSLYTPWLFNLASVAAFSSVLMTYFGVNYFLSGMHSYGQNDHVGGIFLALSFFVAAVAALAVLSYKNK
ncbi:MAG: cytochrome c biogenesis protein CcsA [Tannerellaceae bacterium]|jgi:cytochrome c-type biogenesis protein CcsB|nr:cytochrome c biogenesis protein CcsA [Tannerellaceae bacterium]